MTWPLSQDYNEAVQSPANFADSDLRQGRVVTNALGLPMPFSGTFADVYEVRGADGGRWAVKCFTREVTDLRERYQEISRHLQQARLPFVVDFSYLEKGIRVAGRWFPVLKMQWVEGLTLHQFVSQYADKPAMLEALLQIWVRMGRHLRAAGAAHCDLQHGNVLLIPGSGPNSLALKLIDYDGMFVPALANTPSGEVGHPSYQHPRRAQDEAYSLEVDRFPLLLVATALRALKVGGRALWDNYDNGDNLLFQEDDLRAPKKSALFKELADLGDPVVATLSAHLRKALAGGLESAPLLEQLLPEPRPAAPVAVPVATPVAGTVQRLVQAKGAPAASKVAQRQTELDFEDEPVSGPRSGRNKKEQGGVPVAAIVGGAAALVLLLVGVAGGFFLLRGKVSDQAAQPVLAESHPRVEPETEPEAPVVETKTKDRAQRPGKVVFDPKPKPMALPEELDPDPKGPIGEVRRFEGHTEMIRALSVSPDGRELITASFDNTLRLWNVSNAQELQKWEGHSGSRAHAVAFLPDGRRALSGGLDHSMTIWALPNASGVRTFLGHPGEVHHVAVSRDGRFAASGGPGTAVILWRIDTGKELYRLEGHASGVESLAFSPDAKLLLAGEAGKGNLRLWEVETGRLVRRLEGAHEGGIPGVAFSPDGKHALSGSLDKTVRVWQVEDGKEVRKFDGVGAAVYGLSLSADGRRLLTGCLDGVVRLWDVDTGKVLYAFPASTSPVWPVAFSPDERYAYSAGGDKVVRMWRLPPPGYVPPPPVLAKADTKPVVVKADMKPAIPEQAELIAAEKEIRAIHKAEYAKRKPADVQAFAKQLLKEGLETKDKPAEQYVLLREARDTALRAGDWDLFLQAVGEIIKLFDVAPLVAKAAAVEAVNRYPMSPTIRTKVAALALALADTPSEADDYAMAERLVKAAQTSMTSLPPHPVAFAVHARLREVAALRTAYAGVQDDIRTLAEKPDNADAKLALGKFYALAKGDWDRALPLLASGADSPFKSVAETDMAIPATTGAATLLGDNYAALAATESGAAKTNILCRACYWYGQAAVKLSGLDRTKVDKKRIAIEKTLPPARPVLLTARFGANTGWVDITDTIRWLTVQSAGQKFVFRTGHVELKAHGVPDPAFGETKTVAIAYRYRGGVYLSSTGNTDTAVVPSPTGLPVTPAVTPTAGQEVTILYGWYGYDGKFMDVAPKLQAAVKGSAFVGKPEALDLGDPVPGSHKCLVIVYRRNGRIHLVTTVAHQELNLEKAPASP